MRRDKLDNKRRLWVWSAESYSWENSSLLQEACLATLIPQSHWSLLFCLPKWSSWLDLFSTSFHDCHLLNNLVNCVPINTVYIFLTSPETTLQGSLFMALPRLWREEPCWLKCTTQVEMRLLWVNTRKGASAASNAKSRKPHHSAWERPLTLE